jgi:predicted DNA-binding antitoxin AbrB/MazE fold protein
MTTAVKAAYENGAFKPKEPVQLQERTESTTAITDRSAIRRPGSRMSSAASSSESEATISAAEETANVPSIRRRCVPSAGRGTTCFTV